MTAHKPGTAAKHATDTRLTQVGAGRWRIDGDLGLAQVAALALKAPPAAEAGRVELDLGGVGHSSSAAVALLLEWQAGLRTCGAHLTLANAPVNLCRLAGLSNVAGLLGLADADAAVSHTETAAVVTRNG